MSRHLTPENVAAYLVERGLIAREASPSIASVGRTHRVLRVAVGPTALFVKQPATTLALHYHACRQEASLYALAAHDEILRRLTPRLAYRDARIGLLVSEGRPSAVSLATFAREEGRTPEAFEQKLGEAMARHHARSFDPFLLSKAGFDESQRPPVVLTLGHAPAELWVRLGPIGPQVAVLLRRRRGLARMFDDAQNDWRADALVHGDLGFENIILHPRTAESPLMYFIDWEMACWGDAAWDLATILRTALLATMAEFADEFGAFPAPSPPGARFWRAYAQCRGWDGARRHAEALRVLRIAAIQIAWSIIESSRRSPDFSPDAIHAVERALVLALEPGSALRLFELD